MHRAIQQLYQAHSREFVREYDIGVLDGIIRNFLQHQEAYLVVAKRLAAGRL